MAPTQKLLEPLLLVAVVSEVLNCPGDLWIALGSRGFYVEKAPSSVRMETGFFFCAALD